MPFYGLARLFKVSGKDGFGNLSRKACGATYEVLVIFLDDFVRDPRLVIILAFDVPFRNYLYQILIPVVVLGQKDQVEIRAVLVVLFLMVIVPRDIDFAAYERFYLQIPVSVDVRLVIGHFEEFLDAVHVSVVRNGKGRHFEFACAFEQFLDIGQAIKDGVLGMDVKVDE